MIYLLKYILNEENNEKSEELLNKSKKYNEKSENESKGIYYLKDAISRVFPGEKVSIYKNEKGKPVTDRDDIFVSVTHTGNIVICGISETSIGVDSEIPRENIKIRRIAERFFTEREIVKIEKEGDSAFYEIWCRKEAYSKAEGRGLSYGIKKIETAAKNDIYGRNIFRDEINGFPIFGYWMEEGYFACAGGRGEVSWTEIRE